MENTVRGENLTVKSLGIHNDGEYTLVRFFAPKAERVSLCGDFNCWDRELNPMVKVQGDSCWELELPLGKVALGSRYKFAVTVDGDTSLVSDPYAFSMEFAGGRASRYVETDGQKWSDECWLAYERAAVMDVNREYPLNIYRTAQGNVCYRKLAGKLAPFVKRLGYTHVEIAPYFEGVAFASYGELPQDLMYFVNYMHSCGIGVIFDCTAAALPNGTLFENSGQAGDMVGRVREDTKRYLTFCAEQILEIYHADGLRVGKLKALNASCELKNALKGITEECVLKLKQERPWLMLFLESDNAEPRYTEAPVATCDNEWAVEVSEYFSIDPIFRKYHHRIFKASAERAVRYGERLLSVQLYGGDDAVIPRIFGNSEEKLRQARAVLMYMISQQGFKLVSLGNEFEAALIGERYDDGLRSWSKRNGELDEFLIALNGFYLKKRALRSSRPDSFEWVLSDEAEQNLLAYERRGALGERILCVFNFSGCTVFDRVFTVSPDVVSGGSQKNSPSYPWRVVFSSDPSVEYGSIEHRGGVLRLSIPANTALFLEQKKQ